MKHLHRALAVLAALAASCGGGSGSGGSGSGVVSAGADATVGAAEPVRLEASSTSMEVAGWRWEQLAGPALTDLSGSDTPNLAFAAPSFDATLEFTVSALRADGSTIGSDRVLVTVESLRPEVDAPAVATIDVRGGGQDRAFASALHAATSRLFVIDRVAREVVVFSVANPASPTPVGSFGPPADLPGFRAGEPLAIACGDDGAVAVTWSGETIEFPGRLQLVDPLTLLELNSFTTTGAAPVDIDVTPDGRTVAIACSGAPELIGQGDGRGYVTIVKVPVSGAAAIAVHRDVAPIPLSAFDGREAELEAAGVRFFRSSPESSIDLEPRAVALSPDGRTAWASAPSNNCVITVDVVELLAREIAAQPARPNGSPAGGVEFSGVRIPAPIAVPPLAIATDGTPIPYGGFQGLVSGSLVSQGVLLSAVSGAGPVLEPTDVDGDGDLELPFAAPQLSQGITRVSVGEDIIVQGVLGLSGPAGFVVDGLPRAVDEPAVTLAGDPITSGALGAYFAGGAEAPSGDIWLCDARRSTLWRFDAAGDANLVLSPEGDPGGGFDPSMPAALLRRPVRLEEGPGRRFGGLGAVAFSPSRSAVATMTRLPLQRPDGTEAIGSRILRLIEVDPSTGQTTGEYVYVLERPEHAVEGMAHDGAGSGIFGDGEYAVLEADPSGEGLRAVFRVDPDGATNLRSLGPGDYAAVDAALESTDPSDLGSLPVPIVPVAKRLAVDLVDAGLDSGRPTGIDVEGDLLWVVTDDGFAGVARARPVAGAIGPFQAEVTSTLLGRLEPLRLDTAADGQPAARTDIVPAVALPQALDLAAFDGGGSPVVAAANGGFARVLLDDAGGPPVDDRVRAGDLTLDTMTFPDPGSWAASPFGGDLVVSERDADLDGDGLADRLAVLGGRSVDLIDGRGQTAWTSGPGLIARARALAPGRLDAAATTFGLRPRALCVADLGGEDVLLTVHEGAGLLSVHGLAAPLAPGLQGLVPTAATPVDVDAVATAGGTALAAVTDRGLGRVVLHRVQRR